MIEKIVIDPSKHLFQPVDKVVEKLNYYREVSERGLNKLTAEEFDALKKDINTFFNINIGCFSEIQPTKLFRVTNNKNLLGGKSQKLQKISQLIGPPPENARYNRCNLPNESMFYAALNLRTALWETKPQAGDYITISEWKIKPGEKIVAHSIFHPELTNINPDSEKAFKDYVSAQGSFHKEIGQVIHELLKFLTEQFMKPVPFPEDYHFSAFCSSRLMQQGPDENNFRIEGISYPSIQMKYGLTNLAILNSLVLKKLDLVSIDLWMVGEANYDEKFVETGDFIKISGPSYKVTTFDLEKDKIIYDGEAELNALMEFLMAQKK